MLLFAPPVVGMCGHRRPCRGTLEQTAVQMKAVDLTINKNSEMTTRRRDVQTAEKFTRATALLRLGARQCLGASHSEVKIGMLPAADA